MYIKKGLYILLLGLLLCLSVGTLTPLYESKPLNGWSQEREKPEFSPQTFAEGKYQKDYEAYFNDNSGFRNDFVRLRNQLYYSSLGIVVNDKIINGKGGMLFEKGYIYNGLFGLYAHSKDEIFSKSCKIAKIQDTLSKLGKEFLYVAAPGKGTLYPERIPSYLLCARRKTPPQKEYLRLFDSLGVNHIDLDKFFIEKKKTSSYPLYSKYGSHYNQYGAYLVVDTLTKYLNKKFPFMPSVVLDSLCEKHNVWQDEHDCLNNANLLFSPKRERLPRPYFHYTEASKEPLRCIFVGDSYVWGLINSNIHDRYFSKTQYWYYFNEVFFYGEGREKCSIKDIDILKEISQADVFIVLFTNSTTLDLDNGFTDKVYQLYYGNKE